MTHAALLPGQRPCPGCGCCQFGLCMLASRDMTECSYLSADPPATRDCPCSAVLRRPLTAAPHQWKSGSCRRCGTARRPGAPAPCWYHPHERAASGTCRWCSLHLADPAVPADCPGMPRAVPVTDSPAGSRLDDLAGLPDG